MATFSGFPQDTLAFLADLSEPENNSKAWFDANRARYQDAYLAPAKAFVAAVGARLQAELDPDIQAVPSGQGGSLFRINRDIRFSKDKRPYKDHMDLWFWFGSGKSRTCPGLGFRLRHGMLGAGGGLHGMDKGLLAAYRDAVAADSTGAPLQRLVDGARATGFDVHGEHYKTVPRGYDKDHPRGDLLRHAGLWFGKDSAVPDAVHRPEIVDLVLERFRPAWPLVQWLSEIVEETKRGG